MGDQRFESLLDGISDSVAVLDREGRVVYVNAAGHRLAGAAFGPLTGRIAFDFFPERERGLLP
jgi:PAS domain S-box-containing protein